MTARKPGAMTRQEASVLARAAKAAKEGSASDRFWRKVERRGPDECWPWLGAMRNKDEEYGVFWLDGRNHPANRVALLFSGTPVPVGMVACHRCDNPPCCNPDHLFVGTPLQNNDDKVAKKRHTRGEKFWNAKLTNAQVIAIRAHKPPGVKRLADGLPAKLAAEYGVTPAYISALFTSSRRTD